MLKQPQKKIMSVKDFTNRLTFFSNALEECARAYENSSAGDRVKRYDTRDGFGMLLFCPPKPTDDHQKLYDNIVCHWFYRQQLREAEANAQTAAETLASAEAALADAESAAKLASEALSKAKQQLPEGQTTSPDVAKASQDKQAAEDKLADAREMRKQAKEAANLSEKRCASHQRELERLEKERSKGSKGKGAFDDYLAFAMSVREYNGKPSATGCPGSLGETGKPSKPDDPSCFDDIIGLKLQVKAPTPTDVSRLRTDASNSTILNEFIVSNSVLSPTFADAGFPACKTSLIRDTDPAFAETVAAAARTRVMSLIAAPELAFGAYESAQSRAELLDALSLEDGAYLPHPDDEEETPSNILYEIVTNEAFPIMAEEMLKPAVMEGLARFGDEGAQEDLARKLAVLSYDEQLARDAHARALDGLDSKLDLRYAQRLGARGKMLSLMLTSCLLGATGVENYPVSMENIQNVLTGQPGLTPRKAGKVSARASGGQAVLVEQIPNQEGSFSFGKSIPLPRERAVLIGRAPFSSEQENIIVPAGISPYPGLANFAANVSRAHALLEPSAKGWRLSDAGSSFGTAVLRPGSAGDAGDTGSAGDAGNARDAGDAGGADSQDNPSGLSAALGSGAASGFKAILLVDDDELLLQSGDVVVLAPLEGDNGSIGIDPELGFSYRFEIL